MEEKKVKRSLSLIDRRSTYKLVIPDLVQKKIREWCYNFPTKEWSGTLFYSAEGSFQDGSLVLTCQDIYISDIGSSTYTEFDHTSDIVTYQIEHDLLDCYTGLIHSHQSFSTFFSGTDSDTLVEEGMSMPHFLSLIVNNEGKYTAKITRRVRLETAKLSYTTFGGEQKSEDAEVTVNEYLEAFSLVIDIHEDTCIKDEVLQRIKEIEANKKNKSNFIPYKEFTDISKPKGMIDLKESYLGTSMETANTKFSQPTLFSQEETDDSWINIKVPDDLVKKLVVQLVSGSITATNNSAFDINKWCSSVMEKAFNRRFPDPQDLESWLDMYIEFLTWYTVWKEVENEDADMVAKAVAARLLSECEQLPNNTVLDAIMYKLKTIIE